MDIYISAGCSVNSMNELSLSYDSALRLLDRKFVLSSENVMTCEIQSIPQNRPKDEVFTIEGTAAKLAMAVDMGHEQYVNDIMEELQGRLFDSSKNEMETKTIYINLYTSFINIIIKNNEDIVDAIIQDKNIISEIMDMHNLQKLNGYMKHLAYCFCNEIKTKRPDSIMKKVLEYINRNYYKKLKLSSISEVFGYNSTYFGRYFTQYTKVNFNEYLDKVRIENAKQLLVKGMKVNEVAQKVGYFNKDYFYIKFKKYVGCAPTEYRNNP